MSKNIQDIYEKLRQKQNFNKKVSVSQDNPYNKKIEEKSNVDKMDEHFINELDKKIARKKKGLNNKMDEHNISNELIKLNEKLENIMKIQKRIIGMING